MNVKHLPCPCGKSSDAYVEYPNGGFCYSCRKKFFSDGSQKSISAENKDKALTKQVVPYRGHSIEALQRYGVFAQVREIDGTLHSVAYPIYDEGSIKYRVFSEEGKDRFHWENYKGPGLGGKKFFSAGSSLAVTITEGEEDMLAAYEMLGFKYPVFTVQSAGQAVKDCMKDKEFLDSFEKIYLCFDSDQAGKLAAQNVAAIFPYNKIYIVNKTRYKDANDYLKNGAQEEYKRLWWNAKHFDHEHVISSFSDIEVELSKPKKKAICDFPFTRLQEMTQGIRTGETYLFKALEGIGKTEVMGAIEYHVAKRTDFPIGIIHLEEDLQRTIHRFVNYEIQKPVHLESTKDISNEEIFKIYKQVVRQDNRIHYYSAGKDDNDLDSVVNTIRFLVAACGCRVIFLDHISRIVSSAKVDNERIELDRIATRLSKLALNLDFALIMITHVNDDGLTRGSRNISKEAWTVISLQRDKEAENEQLRNTTFLAIEKNRHASLTGPAGCIYFNFETFTLSDIEPPLLPPKGV